MPELKIAGTYVLGVEVLCELYGIFDHNKDWVVVHISHGITYKTGHNVYMTPRIFAVYAHMYKRLSEHPRVPYTALIISQKPPVANAIMRQHRHFQIKATTMRNYEL